MPTTTNNPNRDNPGRDNPNSPIAPEPASDPRFEEVLEFYTRAGFLYPAKFQALGTRLETVADTWTHLLAAEEVFKLVLLRRQMADKPLATNSVCAYQHAPGVWQIQHLVSSQRHERSGTLTALLALLDWMRDHPNAIAWRLTYRPDNPGTRRLFDELAQVIPGHQGHSTLTTYRLVGSKAALPPRHDGVRVRTARPDDIPDLASLYATAHPSQPEWLRINDLELAGLNARYRQHGLTRQRVLLLAEKAGRVRGAIACWEASEGMNFSFMENAASDLVLDRDLDESARKLVAGALVGAAVWHYRIMRRPFTVLMIDPETDHLLSTTALLPLVTPKRYLTLTFSARAVTQARNHIAHYYADAAPQRPLAVAGAAPGSTP